MSCAHTPLRRGALGGRGGQLDLDALLRHSGLWRTSEDGETILSGEGFRFLLADSYQQLWTVLKAYIQLAGAKSEQGADLSSVVSFLLQLGFRQVSGGEWFSLGPFFFSLK